MNRHTATLLGLVAIVLWSSIVGLIRSVSDALGPIGGAAMIYTIAALLLWVAIGLPRLRTMPYRYLAWGSVLFVAYELCLALSIGYANTSQQAIEVGMVNYLWPTFVLIAAIVFNGQKSSALVVPGLLISLCGITWVLGGEHGLDMVAMLNNVQDNPLSYGLAFSGALIWAGYCTITARLAQGHNAITLFFILTALALWVKYGVVGDSTLVWSLSAAVNVVLAAVAMGFGYAAWNVGILHGNVSVLAGASYFTPVLSAALAALLLDVPLTNAFWLGAAMVCVGAILCWVATRRTA